MDNRVTETFFLPDALGEQAWTLPADIYNLSHTLLGRSEFDCAFVPIRSMQYLAVITREEIVFVDSQAYACHDNEGGCLIMLAWKFDAGCTRGALDQPYPCRVVYYSGNGQELQMRMVSAYREALRLMDRRYRDRVLPQGGARIVPLR
ncbi:MAG: hypothetical protein WBO37_07415 [Gammaproteobacteria bacterium]